MPPRIWSNSPPSMSSSTAPPVPPVPPVNVVPPGFQVNGPEPNPAGDWVNQPAEHVVTAGAARPAGSARECRPTGVPGERPGAARPSGAGRGTGLAGLLNLLEVVAPAIVLLALVGLAEHLV